MMTTYVFPTNINSRCVSDVTKPTNHQPNSSPSITPRIQPPLITRPWRSRAAVDDIDKSPVVHSSLSP